MYSFCKLFEIAINSGICSTQIMDDLNRMRKVLDFSFTDKPLPQDAVNQNSSATNKNTNMSKTKQDNEMPYAN
ncbi:MAG: hypothetical protein ACK5WP_09720 [Neisseriaceae bacterium]